MKITVYTSLQIHEVETSVLGEYYFNHMSHKIIQSHTEELLVHIACQCHIVTKLAVHQFN